MELIKVDESRCVNCGICEKVCPTGVLNMEEYGPKSDSPEYCIACGQCVAVCPNGALDNVRTPSSHQISIDKFPVIDSNTAEKFLRSRRSIRCYKNIPVPKEKLVQLLDVTRFAPTASNSQGISYMVIWNKNILKKATEIVVKWMEEQGENPIHWSFSRHIKNYRENKVDTILRNAPHIILAAAPKNFKNGRENTISYFTYLELFATTLGLASCWAGLLEMCAFSNYPPLLQLFNIPEDKVITGAVMVGYPEYKFKRLVDRNKLEFKFVE